uniref:NAC transcription factor 63 n=1 Tax=Litchi chinensis TaxID=151069 RepID=A0A8K1MD11_LITCN|nr:NAC transcription factor 63 [Litchi chinensis]
MGEAQNDGNSERTPFLLPPGCRFYPSEEELLRYYLTNKNANANNTDDDDGGYNLIKELDLYDYEPHELPERACYAYGRQGRKRHWFCYSKKARVREKSRRRAKNGFWRRRGRVKSIVAVNRGEEVIVGTRKGFVFYLGNSPKTAVRTDWVLYEYQLVDHVKAAFVVCRVFVKSRSGNSVSEIGISSAMEESVSAVRHIGVQHDGSLTSSFLEAELHDDKIIDGRVVSQLDNRVMQGPIPVARFQLPMDTPSGEQVGTSGLTGGDMFVDTLTAQQLISILEEDFIELDDLVS